MKEQTEMPTNGQFVAVWVYDGKTWSTTYKWENGDLLRYDETEDIFIEAGGHFAPGSQHTKFFTA